MLRETSSAINPTVIHDQGDYTTGMGGETGELSNITGGVERQRWSANTTGLPVSTIFRDAVGIESLTNDADTIGLALVNTTPATTGADNHQNSPGLMWEGRLYNGVSEAFQWSAWAESVWNSESAHSVWKLASKDDNGFKEFISISSLTDVMTVRAALVPETDSVYDLGLTGTRWDKAFIDDLTLTDAINIGGALNHDGTLAGFFSTAPVAKPTGVAVDAAGIHAALVTLGLISGP